MVLLKIVLTLMIMLLVFWTVYSLAPREIRDPLVFLLIGFVWVFYSDPFRNWRLRRKLERISRHSIKVMSQNKENNSKS